VKVENGTIGIFTRVKPFLTRELDFTGNRQFKVNVVSILRSYVIINPGANPEYLLPINFLSRIIKTENLGRQEGSFD
jgi:hypothetical protein